MFLEHDRYSLWKLGFLVFKTSKFYYYTWRGKGKFKYFDFHNYLKNSKGKKTPSNTAILFIAWIKSNIVLILCKWEVTPGVPSGQPASQQEQDPQGSHLGAVRAVKLVAQGILSTCGGETQGLEPATWKGKFLSQFFSCRLKQKYKWECSC